ncbi:MAG TPA: ZIP family metal transporter, partial [Clostridia bacterium]|nr:ZIP family metal transporter [Clostridia bacterium]
MIAGVVAGTGFVSAADKLVPHLHSVVGVRPTDEHASSHLNRVLLFVLAIAIHNFPEGMAVGVGFGGGEISHALMVAIGIALQNIPEGFVVIFPLMQTGMSRPRVLAIGLFTGLVELLGTIVGILLTSISATLLPFMLAFAGGTMLYIICDEIIPDTHCHGNEKIASFCLIGGFLLMMIMDAIL